MPEQQPTLRDMINDALSRGATYAQLEERAVDPATGRNGASGGYINRIANGKVDRMPTAGHLRALAAGLGKPYDAVRHAAIAQWLPAEQDQAAADEADRQAQIAELKRLRDQADEALRQLDPDRQAS